MKTKLLFLSFLAFIFLLSLTYITDALANTGSWENQKTHRPRLLYEPKELNSKINKETIVSRILGPQAREPYISWYRQVKQRAGYSFVNSDKAGERKINATIAKNAAFVYAMEGIRTYGDKALQGLHGMNTSVGYTDYDDYIWIAEELMQFCQAYDLLLGAKYPFSNTRDKTIAKNRIEDLTINLYKKTALGWMSDYNPYAYNNYRIKAASALGMAAITLNDEEAYYYFTWQHPREWMGYCLHTLDKILATVQTTDKEGGYAEGPHYLKFSATNYLPFMWAYYLFTDGQDTRILGKTYKSPLKDQRFKNIHDWIIKIRMPDGRMPAIDDSFMDDYFYNGMLAGIYQEIFGQGREYAWDWIESKEPYYVGDLAVDLICAYDDTVKPLEPTWKPTQFLPEAGNVIFRSNWGKDATYMALLGEHGDMRSRGLGHDHPDATSFIIYAKGELLAMDPGYISWDQREKVNRAKNHNLVLVDGISGVDAYIENYFDMDSMKYSEVRTMAYMNYVKTDIRRSVIFPEGKYFIIVDDLQSLSAHNYDWLLHGNGGGTSGGSCDKAENGAVWSIGRAKLKAYITTTDGRATINSDKLDYHEGGYNRLLTHNVLKANRYASKIKFLTVLYPAGIGENFPAMRDFYAKGAVGIEIKRPEINAADVIIARDNKEPKAEISAGASGLKDIVTDAQHLFVSAGAASKEIRYFFAKGATYFKYDGNDSFKTSKPADIAIEIDNVKKEIRGYINGQGDMVQLNTGNKPDTLEGVSSWNYSEGAVTFFFTGKTQFTIKLFSLGGSIIFPKKVTGNAVPLPVLLKRVTPTFFSAPYNGEYYGYGMQIEWQPTTHPKAKYYHIQYSVDMVNWLDITAYRPINLSWVNHTGSIRFVTRIGNLIRTYSHCLPSGKKYYYRVRVITEDGKVSDWSNIMSATVASYSK